MCTTTRKQIWVFVWHATDGFVDEAFIGADDQGRSARSNASRYVAMWIEDAKVDKFTLERMEMQSVGCSQDEKWVLTLFS